MSLARLLGIPTENTLPRDEETQSRWFDLLEQRAAEMIGAGVVVSLSDWAKFSALERAVYRSLKEQAASVEPDIEPDIEPDLEALSEMIARIGEEVPA